MSIKKLKKKSVKPSQTQSKCLKDLELQLFNLESRLATLETKRWKKNNIQKKMKSLLESAQTLCGAVHQEASDFVDYLEQARLEIDEFKTTTMKEIKTLNLRTKKYPLDDNKDILLEEE